MQGLVGVDSRQSIVDSGQSKLVRSRHIASCLLPTAYCLLPTAYCLLPAPPHLVNSLRSRLADIGYYVKKFMYSMGNNGCELRGLDSLSESKRGRGPSRSHGHRLCDRGPFEGGTEKAHG